MKQNPAIRRLAATALFVLTATWAQAADAPLGPRVHALSMGGTPKYAKDFTHFDYVRPDAPKGGVFRRHSLGSFDNFSPFAVKGRPAAGFHGLDDALCVQSLDEINTVYGLIAESIQVSTDHSRIRFHINPKARFHDGGPIRAKDVIFSFNALKGKLGSGLRRFFKDVRSVQALDPLRVEFRFAPKAPRELYLIIACLQVYPSHYWSKREMGRTTLEIPVGSGPYRIASFDLGRNIVYQRVKDYWAKDLPVCRGMYNFDELRYEYFRDDTVALEAFRAGLYDLRMEYAARHWEALKQIPGVKTVRLSHDQPMGIEGFFFNTRRAPFNDPLVRQSLILAFDWKWTNTHLLYGQYQRCNSFFSNSDLSAAKAGWTPALPVTNGNGFNRGNLVKAHDLLCRAGWTVKEGRRVNAKGTPLTFRLLVNSSGKQRLAQPWFFNLSKLGIRASAHLVDSAQFIHRLDNYDYDMIASAHGQRLWPGQEILFSWHSEFARPDSGGRNLIGLKDPVVDSLLTRILNARNRKQLIQAGRCLDQRLMSGHYVIPLGVSTTYNLAVRRGIAMPDHRPGYALGESCWWAEPVTEF